MEVRAINFCGWTVGPRDDYDEWADIVGAKRFGWSNVNRVLKRIENLNVSIPELRMKKLLAVKSEGEDLADFEREETPTEHSTSGNLDLTYGDAWSPDISDIFVAAEQSGHRTNSDVNNGHPIGMGMGSVCISNGIRATSASAYLSHPPPNMKILPDTHVARILFEGKRATGVQTIDGRKLLTRKEVIVSGGALNTPQILMLSGVGSAEELRKQHFYRARATHGRQESPRPLLLRCWYCHGEGCKYTNGSYIAKSNTDGMVQATERHVFI